MRQRSPLVFGLVAALLLGAATDHLRERAHVTRQDAWRYEDTYYLPPPDWLRVFSLGWHEALADLLWMRALVYFGDEFANAGAVRHVFDYGEAIATLDPHFPAVYRWVGMAGLYRPQAISAADAERSVEFMQRGALLFPLDGRLAWDIGAALAFELPPLLDDEEAGNRARERGMPYLMTAARLGVAPEWTVLTNAAILGHIGREEQAARHLEEMYASVRDPALRARIAESISVLRERTRARAFMEAINEEEAARARNYPYLSSGLYLLVGPRPPIDLVTPVRLGLPRALASSSERVALGTP